MGWRRRGHMETGAYPALRAERKSYTGYAVYFIFRDETLIGSWPSRGIAERSPREPSFYLCLRTIYIEIQLYPEISQPELTFIFFAPAAFYSPLVPMDSDNNHLDIYPIFENRIDKHNWIRNWSVYIKNLSWVIRKISIIENLKTVLEEEREKIIFAKVFCYLKNLNCTVFQPLQSHNSDLAYYYRFWRFSLISNPLSSDF